MFVTKTTNHLVFSCVDSLQLSSREKASPFLCRSKGLFFFLDCCLAFTKCFESPAPCPMPQVFMNEKGSAPELIFLLISSHSSEVLQSAFGNDSTNSWREKRCI